MFENLCDMLQIRYPIIQGAMTNVSDATLVAAVSNAGGLGILAAGARSEDISEIEQEIHKTKALTNKPFGVNIVVSAPAAEKVVDLVCRERISLVTTGAGNPKRFVKQLKAHGVKIVPVVPSVEIALKMQYAGADMVVAEGMESGGFIGRMSTMALIPQTVDALDIPVIAAGGIADGRGMAAVAMLGAAGVQIGTRFLSAAECGIAQKTKDMVLQAAGSQTVVIGERIGYPSRQRLLATEYAKHVQEYEAQPNAEVEEYVRLTGNEAYLRAVDGDMENGLIACGQALGLVNRIQSVGDIIEEMVMQYGRLMPQ